MNDLVNQNNRLAVSTETASLIQSSVAPNTIAAYRRATQKLESWLNGQILTDGLLATYITELHQQGKSPATIAQAVAAVKWTASKSHIDVVGEITQRTLAGISTRREVTWAWAGRRHSLVRGGSSLRVCGIGQFHRGAEGRRVDSAHERLSLTCQ